MSGARADAPLKVVLIGPESTGKTWLARELAERYQAPWAAEYVRAYCEEQARPIVYRDVEAIADGQREGEDLCLAEAKRARSPLVLLDTDLVSTVVYSRHYYGDCPPAVESLARERRADLYLLHHVDVPWVADGDQREAPEGREELFESFRSKLESLKVQVCDVLGSWEERRQLAVDAIDLRLAAG